MQHDESPTDAAVGIDLDVSVVLPVFNERGHLDDEIERIRKALTTSPYAFEIVVVDDGSTDGSCDDLKGIDEVRVIRLPENRGSGTARRIGTAASRGRIVVWTDADMTYPNDAIPDLVAELDGYDQVVGARTKEAGTARLLRSPAKWFIRRLAGYLMRARIPDLNSGFRAFRRDVALKVIHLLPAGFSCTSTMTLTFLSGGYRVKHVPISYARRVGRSKFGWWSDTKRYLTQVVRMVLSYEPLRVFGPLGVALMFIGLAKLGYDWATKDFHMATNTLLIFFAAFQTLVLGFLADLVVRTARSREDG